MATDNLIESIEVNNGFFLSFFNNIYNVIGAVFHFFTSLLPSTRQSLKLDWKPIVNDNSINNLDKPNPNTPSQIIENINNPNTLNTNPQFSVKPSVSKVNKVCDLNATLQELFEYTSESNTPTQCKNPFLQCQNPHFQNNTPSITPQSGNTSTSLLETVSGYLSPVVSTVASAVGPLTVAKMALPIILITAYELYQQTGNDNVTKEKQENEKQIPREYNKTFRPNY